MIVRRPSRIPPVASPCLSHTLGGGFEVARRRRRSPAVALSLSKTPQAFPLRGPVDFADSAPWRASNAGPWRFGKARPTP